MSVLDSFQSRDEFTRQADLVSTAQPAPVEEPGAFAGLGQALVNIPEHGFDIAAMLALKAIEKPAVSIAETLPFETTVQAWFDEATEERRRDLAASRPDPKTMGWAAQGVQQMGTLVASGIAGFAAAGPVGSVAAVSAMSGMDKYWELYDQTGDHDASENAALVTAGVMGIGSALAPYYGGTLLKQLASGIGINVGLGMTERAGIGAIMEDAGHTKVAEHYKMLDSTSIGVDAILGAGFVGLGRFAQAMKARIPVETVDQAMVAESGIRARTGGGELATTPNAFDPEIERAAKVTDQLIDGVPLRQVVVDPPHPDTDVNPKLADDVIIGNQGIRSFAEESTGRPADEVLRESQVAAEVIGARDAFQVRSAEEVDVLQQAGDGEAMAARDTQEEAAGARAETQEEVVKRYNDLTVEDFERANARAVLERNPDMTVPNKDGVEVPASEIMRQMDEEVRIAEIDASLHNVAVTCFLNRGNA